MTSPLLLCVDDDLMGLHVRKLALASAGYRVLTAAGGAEALRIFAGQPVAAVLLDYKMPEMNGAEMARRMRELKPRVPIVMLSAYFDLPPEAAALADAVMSKIAPPPELFELIARLAGPPAPRTGG